MMKKCSKCGLVKPISDFKLRNKKTNIYQPYCKKCKNQYLTTYWNYKKLKAIDYLGGMCQDCGKSFHPIIYDFHHRNPNEKEFGLNKNRSRSWEIKKEELDKCDLLCSNCHKIRHSKEIKKSKYDGSEWFDNNILIKHCTSCLKFKEIKWFTKKRKSKTARCGRCSIDYRVSKSAKKKLKAIDYLGGKCKDCGKEFHQAAYDFHHRDPNEKECGINKLRDKSWDHIVSELDKCDLLCSNCHRIRHTQDKNWDFSSFRKNIKKPKQIKKKTPKKIIIICEECGSNFEVRHKNHNQKYCSYKCTQKARETICWPINLPELVAESSKSAVARSLGVSDNAVIKRLRNHHTE